MEEINRFLLQLLAGITCGRQKACGNKIGHTTELRAYRQMEHLEYRLGGPDHRVEVYPCPWCYRWHVGRPFSDTGLRHLSLGVRHVQDGQDQTVADQPGGPA